MLCQSGWWPGVTFAAAVDLTREHSVTAAARFRALADAILLLAAAELTVGAVAVVVNIPMQLALLHNALAALLLLALLKMLALTAGPGSFQARSRENRPA